MSSLEQNEYIHNNTNESSPSRLVFNSLGVIELENQLVDTSNCSCSSNSETSENDECSSSSSSVDSVFQYELDRNILGSSISFSNSNNDIPDMYDVDLGLRKQHPNENEGRHDDINDIEQAMETWNYRSVATRLRAKKIKRCCVVYISSFPVVVAIVLLATCALLLVVLLDPRDDVGISNTPTPFTQPNVEAMMVIKDTPKPAEVKADDFASLNLSEYGFLYTQDVSEGWMSWQKHLDSNFVSFTKYDGITSVDECAAKCGELEGHAGAWGVRLEACWCRLSGGLSTTCKEPCVKERFVEFSVAPFNQYEYCSMSICSKDIDHSLFNEEYCEEVEFDNDECVSRIKELESPYLPLDT